MRSEIADEIAISFEAVSKHYSLSLQKEATDFKNMLLHMPRFLSNARRPFVALDGVSGGISYRRMVLSGQPSLD